MKINAPTSDASTIDLADWLEVLALLSEKRNAGEGDLRHLLLGPEDDRALVPTVAEAEEEAEQEIQSVFNELEDRAHWGGRGYPFVIEGGRNLLKWRHSDLQDVDLAYAFSLLATNFKTLKETFRKQFTREGELEDLFQACGTIAASGYIDGNAISFGHPRDNDPGFYSKLGEIADIVREGAAQKNFTPGVSPNPKDAGVDIIAWRLCRDKAPGHVYMLGQCASGSNWDQKKPLTDYENFHKDYWTKPPPSPRLAAFFMPFDLRQWASQTGYDTLADAWHWHRWRHTRDYGVIIDRFRLAHFFARGLALARRNRLGLRIEGRDKLVKLRSWVRDVTAFLRV